MYQSLDIWKFIAGLGIFLFGMYQLEAALRQIAGRAFKKFLRKHTRNKFKSILSGTFVTIVLQSSSVVSLMALAFVGAGIIEMRNALGIILGSNLGTTFTGWVVATLGFQVHIESFALPVTGIGAIWMLALQKRPRWAEFGKLLVGFGFLFLGLDYMKTGVETLADQVDLSVFSHLGAWAFLLVGFVVTGVIQSSSAMMVITLSALNAGIIPLDAAMALVIGADLGTTITVLLGGFGGVPPKRRLALGHFLFNLITDLIAFALLPLIYWLFTDVMQIENALYSLVLFHSTFNLLGIFIFFPFLGLFARFLENRYKDGSEKVAKYLPNITPEETESAIIALDKEAHRLIDQVIALNLACMKITAPGLGMKDRKTEKLLGIFPEKVPYLRMYENVKQLEGEIMVFYSKLMEKKLNEQESDMLKKHLLGVRHAMFSAKNLKDVRHNLKDFANSGNDEVHQMYLKFRGHSKEFYNSIHDLIYEEGALLHFEELAELKKRNREAFHRFIKEIYSQAGVHTFSDLETANLMNVIREIYGSNKALLNSLKDMLLSKERAADLDEIPTV